MSWFMFKQSAEVKQRGIKVDGFQDMHRQRVNLSWGINEKQMAKDDIEKNTMPLTYQPKKVEAVSEAMKVTKVLTDTSEDGEEEELIKLIKYIKQATKQRKNSDNPTHNQPINARKYQNTEGNRQQHRFENPVKDSQFSKRMQYLQNSLLPQCRRDSMGTILDHRLNKEVPLTESRMSSKSFRQNKKNQSQIALGDGFNFFRPTPQQERDHLRRLKEMYDYDDKCKERTAKNQIVMG